MEIEELMRRIGPEHGHFQRLLRDMTAAQRDALIACATTREVAATDAVLVEGTEPADFGYVVSGALGMVKRLPDDRVHIIGILVPTDMFGRLFGGGIDYRIEALSDSELLCFRRDGFEALLRDSPELERLFLVMVLDELDAAREWILVLSGTQVAQRVASFLLILARRHLLSGSASDGHLSVKLPVSRTHLSHLLGIRPESLSRALHKLQDRRLVELGAENRIAILDLPGLIEISGQDLILEGDTP